MSRSGSEPGDTETEPGGDTGPETLRERRVFTNYALLGPALRGRSAREVVDASPYERQSSGSE